MVYMKVGGPFDLPQCAQTTSHSVLVRLLSLPRSLLHGHFCFFALLATSTSQLFVFILPTTTDGRRHRWSTITEKTDHPTRLQADHSQTTTSLNNVNRSSERVPGKPIDRSTKNNRLQTIRFVLDATAGQSTEGSRTPLTIGPLTEQKNPPQLFTSSSSSQRAPLPHKRAKLLITPARSRRSTNKYYRSLHARLAEIVALQRTVQF